jgi:hypothetical protein
VPVSTSIALKGAKKFRDGATVGCTAKAFSDLAVEPCFLGGGVGDRSICFRRIHRLPPSLL